MARIAGNHPMILGGNRLSKSGNATVTIQHKTMRDEKA
jgi:hypothetical protein